jgi:hypothetical protein
MRGSVGSTLCAIALAALAQVATAEALECPVPAAGGQGAEIRALLPTGDAFADVARLNASVATLRQKGISQALIIDGLIGAYCPLVAANAGLTDAQRTARVRQFAARIARTVYALDSADEIILDVPFAPAAVEAINARAKAAGMSPESWVADAVGKVLGTAR